MSYAQRSSTSTSGERGGRPAAAARHVRDPAAPVRAGSRLDGEHAAGACSTPRRAAGTWTWRPADCGQRAAASTRSARPATRPTRPSPRRCARPTRPCCTTGPAPSTWPGRPRCPARPAPGRAARAGRRRPTSRSPAAATRSSAATSWPSSRRRRRSPRTCRARVGVAFSIGRAAKLGVACPWPRDAVDGGQLRRRLGQPLDRDRRDQRRLPHRLSGACRCRCCWSARTTASGSACGPRTGGSRRRSRPARPALLRADGSDPPPAYDAAASGGQPASGPGSSPAFLHLRWCGSSATPGSDAEIGYRRPLRSRPTTPATRCSAPRPPGRLRPAHPGQAVGTLRGGRRAGQGAAERALSSGRWPAARR